jgi:hypothetical protein
MKRTLLLWLPAIAWIAMAAAEHPRLTPPSDVVRNLIVGAKANDLDVVLHSLDFAKASLGRHGRTAEDLVAFLRAIELDGAEFVATTGVSIPPPRNVGVMLQTPTYALHFRLELHEFHPVKQENLFVPRDFPVEPHYVVVEVLPAE